ncbi:adenylate/guanylate cyclase domain-containing protein [Pseudobacteroides cellulosolvens]|uniref:Adenylate/guanylate cyclase n=1 Tax=Pseudobacteroides cellulosolvens ATCC 35603 = DSM 2933 TaxID=398512 RepID=A0A0L6JI12_9FIRM|nr:adenylate/guanylate cyclase domain-containing protein [Pseudobacteroides cellulosolvens]KNY25350.1 adenylate/guanylate cyclase [Pseudobacteroides cellulosolvens ATCC 35603 = DSM 2933]
MKLNSNQTLKVFLSIVLVSILCCCIMLCIYTEVPFNDRGCIVLGGIVLPFLMLMGLVLDSSNSMYKKLKNHITNLEKVQKAYERFFPKQFMYYMDKNDITDLKRKDYKSNAMGVMVTSICSYYTFSRDMTDEERFEFIDEYINNIGPVIYKKGGFISKFTGCGAMVLFPQKDKTDNILDTALSIQKNIRAENDDRIKLGEKPYQIGVGIHVSDSVLLGIVGFKSKAANVDRLELAILDEQVVLTESIQNASQLLGASVLATESIIKNLEHPENYKYRYLGLALFESIQQKIEIYDVYQEDDEELRKAKESTKKQFEEAVLLYQKQEFKKAKNIFIEIVSNNDRDLAAKMYYFLCDEYSYMDKLPQNWDKQINL